jgi:hypothetical protein
MFRGAFSQFTRTSTWASLICFSLSEWVFLPWLEMCRDLVLSSSFGLYFGNVALTGYQRVGSSVQVHVFSTNSGVAYFTRRKTIFTPVLFQLVGLKNFGPSSSRLAF